MGFQGSKELMGRIIQKKIINFRANMSHLLLFLFSNDFLGSFVCFCNACFFHTLNLKQTLSFLAWDYFNHTVDFVSAKKMIKGAIQIIRDTPGVGWVGLRQSVTWTLSSNFKAFGHKKSCLREPLKDTFSNSFNNIKRKIHKQVCWL